MGISFTRRNKQTPRNVVLTKSKNAFRAASRPMSDQTAGPPAQPRVTEVAVTAHHGCNASPRPDQFDFRAALPRLGLLAEENEADETKRLLLTERKRQLGDIGSGWTVLRLRACIWHLNGADATEQRSRFPHEGSTSLLRVTAPPPAFLIHRRVKDSRELVVSSASHTCASLRDAAPVGTVLSGVRGESGK